MPTTLIISATSAMAEQTARRLAADGEALLLAGRDTRRLNLLADDLKLRGAADATVLPPFDAADLSTLGPLVENAGEVDRVLIAHGTLPDQKEIENSPEEVYKAVCINQLSVIELCTRFGTLFEAKSSGTLAVISSVAGLRGRQSNYIYGAAKSGVNTYLQGLRNRLHPKGVRVLTILPGFVDSPMTADIEKGPLFISAGQAGKCIHKALTCGKRDVVYVPFFWWGIMAVIRLIPECLFKRLKL